uniref:RNA-directed RNA polymerase n=1 Tax=Hymenopteran tombus-related virus TaxID=2822555 RepID=A0A8A6RRR4_9TOMB|nr:RNA-dependent RNA polymerase [Hymenopteran tombus-related virus]
MGWEAGFYRKPSSDPCALSTYCHYSYSGNGHCPESRYWRNKLLGEVYSKCTVEKLLPGARIHSFPASEHRAGQTYRILYQTGFEYKVGMHGSCICNEYRSLTERHLKDHGQRIDEVWWKKLTLETEKFYNTKLQPFTFQEVISGYEGVKKRRYEKALNYIMEYGLQPKHARVKMFIKNDRFPLDKLASKAPRAIQYRTPEINLVMAKYIKPFEHHYYKELTYGVKSATRVIAKGLNWRQRAEILIEKASYFNKPKFYLLDHSSFDATISVPMLRSTHRKYVKVFGRHVRKLFQCQVNNKCWTKFGIKYTVQGTRMSGDADTACGNTIINLDAIYGVLQASDIKKYDMLVDGDDAVLIVENESHLDTDIFRKAGLNTKVQICHNILDVEFCQSRIIFTPDPIFVRNPYKVISHAPYCRRTYPRRYDDWLSAVGMCELACNPGVPILAAFGKALSSLGTGKRLFDNDLLRRMEGMKVEEKKITLQARESFYRAWNVSPPMQEIIEQCITSYSINDKVNEHTIFRFSFDNKDVESLQRQRAWYECSTEHSGSCWWNGGTGGYRSIN